MDATRTNESALPRTETETVTGEKDVQPGMSEATLEGPGQIVAPEGKRVGLLARLKKPRPLPSRRRLAVMM